MADKNTQQKSTQQENQGQQLQQSRQGGAVERRGGMESLLMSPGALLNANPFTLMRQMQSEMDRMFADAFGGGLMSGGRSGASGGGLIAWAPPIEVAEREGNLVVRADLPGLRPEDVRIEVTPDALVMEGERRSEQESNEGGRYRSERHYGRFHRAIALPDGVDAEQARARFENGVLEITLPMPQQQKRSRQIPIEGSAGAQAGSNQQSQGGGDQTGSTTQSGSTS